MKRRSAKIIWPAHSDSVKSQAGYKTALKVIALAILTDLQFPKDVRSKTPECDRVRIFP